ncbi:MAG: hypothetical protein Q8J85_07210 [Sulfuricurvum sp.]|nr:hypothetical protein [Sulfuricurvum sp.]MDP3022985.1 hypothetical protein [Sulfuricurvum sp.]
MGMIEKEELIREYGLTEKEAEEISDVLYEIGCMGGVGYARGILMVSKELDTEDYNYCQDIYHLSQELEDDNYKYVENLLEYADGDMYKAILLESKFKNL